MENNLWIFGDSFSNFFKLTRPDYIDFKNKYVKCYGELISEELNLNLQLRASGGYSNESIFFSIINNLENIKIDDVIIINWTENYRFRLLNNDNNFMDFNINGINNYEENNISNISKKTVEEILIHRTEKNYGMDLNNYIKTINKAFINNKIIHWSWVNYKNKMPLSIDYVDMETITQDTNGLIYDFHYSEKSHIILSKNFINLINGNTNNFV
jgi:hypothetical protein